MCKVNKRHESGKPRKRVKKSSKSKQSEKEELKIEKTQNSS
jgi:hypothetical protein